MAFDVSSQAASEADGTSPSSGSTPGARRGARRSVDLAAQLGVDHQIRDALRHALVLAAAASRRAAPIDGVITSLADDSLLRADLNHAVTVRFTGKRCIHPSGRDSKPAPFPSDTDHIWARDVIAAAQDGSVTGYDGHMIDPPVALRARAVISRAHPAIEGQAPGPHII